MKKILIVVAAIATFTAVYAQGNTGATATSVQPGSGATPKGDCSPNGLIAANSDGSGEILSCEHKKWVQLAHGDQNKGATPKGDCSPNGLVAANPDGSGEILSCEHKKWVQLGSAGRA